jgi:hypothetical protein
VPEDAAKVDVMDEGVWLSSTTDFGSATETGYVSGWWPYTMPHTWLSGLRAYGTELNGTNGVMSPNWMTYSSPISAWSQDTGDESLVWQDGSWFWEYDAWATITGGRFNFAQGEVHADGCDSNGNNCSPWPWMGNGSGQGFVLEYENSSFVWQHWGNLTTGDYSSNSPYWSTWVSNYDYNNGGD